MDGQFPGLWIDGVAVGVGVGKDVQPETIGAVISSADSISDTLTLPVDSPWYEMAGFDQRLIRTHGCCEGSESKSKSHS
jgi:hypothetical protein